MQSVDLLKLVPAAGSSWCKGGKGKEKEDRISAEMRGEVFSAFSNPTNGP